MKKTLTETARTSEVSERIPTSPDSEAIAARIRNFKYDPERREAVLAKYEKLLHGK